MSVHLDIVFALLFDETKNPEFVLALLTVPSRNSHQKSSENFAFLFDPSVDLLEVNIYKAVKSFAWVCC